MRLILFFFFEGLVRIEEGLLKGKEGMHHKNMHIVQLNTSFTA